MRNIFAYRTWLERSWSFFRAHIFIVFSLWKVCHQIWSLSFDCLILWTSCFITLQSQNLETMSVTCCWKHVRKQKEGNSKNKKKLTICSGKSAGTKVVCGKCPSGDETRAARAFDLRKNPKCFLLWQLITYTKDWDWLSGLQNELKIGLQGF